MSGQHGRADGDLRRGSDGEDLGPGGGDTSEETGRSANMSIESVIDWKRIVGMYYQLNGKTQNDDEEAEN
uniref:Uncharacterized protein n=1 Tax=Acrobeloides nanus TaxID=290746 RepID=A0A914DHS1_9BILA